LNISLSNSYSGITLVLKRAGLSAAFLFLTACACDLPVYAQLPPGEGRADDDLSGDLGMSLELRKKFRELDVSLILTIIELARFNIAFREEANVRWVWRSILYPAAQEAATACTLSNAIIDLKERAEGLHNLDLISSGARQQGLAAAVTGSCIGAASSAAELTQNGLVCWLKSKRGFSPASSLAFVKEKRAHLDSTLALRRSLIDELPDGKVKELRKLESLILMRTRNQLLREFTLWSADSRARMWRENTFYTLDVTQQILSTVSSALSSRSINNSVYSGPSAVCGLVSKSISTANPIIRTVAGNFVRKRRIYRLSAQLAERKVARAEKLLEPWGDEEAILDAAARHGGTDRQIEQLEILTSASLKFDRALDRERLQLEKLQRVATQQAISGPAIGMLSLTQQILNTVASYGYSDNPDVSNKIKFAGRIPQIAGLGYSLVNTPSTQILNFMKNRKLRREGKHPSQELKRRLQHLTEIETTVRAWTSGP